MIARLVTGDAPAEPAPDTVGAVWDDTNARWLWTDEPAGLWRQEVSPDAVGSGATPGGLPYPTIDDHLGLTDQYIADLADAVEVRLANSGIVLMTVNVTTDGNGDAWLRFPGLTRLDGCVPQAVTGSTYTIYPAIVGMDGGNGAIVRYRKAPISQYSAVMTPWVGGLTVCAYGWGQ